MASTAFSGTVFAFWVLLIINSMYFYCFHVFHREFLWPTSAKWVSTLIFCITGIRNGLNTKRSLHSSAYFTFLVISVNQMLTGPDLCQSQPIVYYLISSNASHSICLFLAQWRLISSESAVSLLFLTLSLFYQWFSRLSNVLILLLPSLQTKHCASNYMECFTRDVQ